MRTLTLFLMAICLATAATAQSVKRIRLKSPGTPVPSKIRVTAVIDERADTGVIGTMRAGLGSKVRAVSLEGGVAAAMQELLAAYHRPVSGATAVELHIRGLEISEKATGMGERLTIQYKYVFVGPQGELGYEGSAYAEATLDASPFVERLVRESLTNTFDKVAAAWKDEEAAAPPKVSVSVKIEPQPAGTGLLSYDRSRPLGYTDFKGVPDDLSLGSAATYTGISFAYAAQQTGSEFRIIVTLSAITDPEKSWMRPSGKNAKVLAHENLHFAITALMACRLADSLRQTVVTEKDYDAKLRQVFNVIERQQEQQQRLYDQETVHGTNAPKQAAWEAHIYAELKRRSCYGH